LFRLNWWQRLIASVPIEILKYCYLDQDTSFDFPSWERLSQYNIIVSTTVTTGFLRTIPSPILFDLILIDEVSQATEAETFVPISLIKPSTGIVVLAGDPEQLGPTVRSPAYHEIKGGAMTQSLLEKLLKQKFYSNIIPDTSMTDFLDNYSNQSYFFLKFGTYLTSNYRSQKSILSLPSQLFYKNSLKENSLKQKELDSLGKWKELKNAKLFSYDSVDEESEEEEEERECEEEERESEIGEGREGKRKDVKKKGKQEYDQYSSSSSSSSSSLYLSQHQHHHDKKRPFVVLFHGVDGRHRHEIDSPAFYNLEEIEIIINLCSSLLHPSSGLHITTKDIGIIGAFRSQILKLRLSLRQAHLGGINVGSVEDFQGQEIRIIIISTVLSHRIPSLEMNGSLGLLGDHRKFNVSLTRGMHLTIVVGHPYCLITDPYWKQFMNYCDEHGTYTGYPCTLLERIQVERIQDEELLNSIARISLLGVGLGSNMTSSRHTSGQYFSDNLEWRGLL
jgi:hypothetical protein